VFYLTRKKFAELGYGLDEWPCVAAAEAAG
jgi:hypothetical protein